MSLYVDGGCSKHTGDSAWGSVVDNKGIDVLVNSNLEYLQDMDIKEKELARSKRNIIIAKFNDVASQQTNGSELLSLVAGLRIALYTNIKIIYSDSQLMVDWWSKGHVSAAKRKTIDNEKLSYIEECAKLRLEFESKGGKIVKISGDKNLADLGWHK